MHLKPYHRDFSAIKWLRRRQQRQRTYTEHKTHDFSIHATQSEAKTEHRIWIQIAKCFNHLKQTRNEQKIHHTQWIERYREEIKSNNTQRIADKIQNNRHISIVGWSVVPFVFDMCLYIYRCLCLYEYLNVCWLLKTGFLKRGTRLPISRCGLEIATRIRTFVQLTSLTDVQLCKCFRSNVAHALTFICMFFFSSSLLFFFCSFPFFQCVCALFFSQTIKSEKKKYFGQIGFQKPFFCFCNSSVVVNFLLLRRTIRRHPKRQTIFRSDLFDWVYWLMEFGRA